MSEESPSAERSKPLSTLGQHTIIYGLGQAVGPVLGLLLLPVFTAYLSPADYGVLALLGILSLVAKSVFSMGSGPAIGVCYYEKEERPHQDATIWTASCLYTATAVVVCVGAVGAPQIGRLLLLDPQYSYEVALTLLTAAALIVTDPFLLKLRFDQRAKTFVLVTAVGTAGTIGLTAFLVVFMERGVRGYVEGMLIGRVVAMVMAGVPALFGVARTLDKQVLKKLLHHGIPMVPSFLFLFLLRDANKYLLQCFEGDAALGIYNVGMSLAVAMDIAVCAFTTAWYPFYLSFMNRQEEAKAVFARVYHCYVVGFGAVTVLFFVFARPVVSLMTAAPFHDAYQVVGLIASTHFLIGLASILSPGLYFAKNLKILPWLQAIAAVTGLVASVVLIPILGPVGTALAVLFGCALLPALYHWACRRHGYLVVPVSIPETIALLLVYLSVAGLAYTIHFDSLLVNSGWSLFLGAIATLLAWLLLGREGRSAAIGFLRSHVSGKQPVAESADE